MAATHKPFRELIKPGSNFEFVGRTRAWIIISLVLCLGSVAMLFVNKAVRGDYLNWTIDFKGGTEMIFAFRDKEAGQYKSVSPGDVRKALGGGGIDNFEVSGYSWTDDSSGTSVTVEGLLIRTPSFGAIDAAKEQEILSSFRQKFDAKGILSATWSGDRIFVRSKQPIAAEEASQFVTGLGLEMKPWDEEQKASFTTPDEGSGEYLAQVGIFGLERQFAKVLEAANLGAAPELVQSYAVGARAGEELRNDGAKSLFYALALIMLYLAVRFDIRYAPGAVVALFHDALLVVGAFAVLWIDFSLTTVAALLTVIGYSVNDTVVIFDRIRENVAQLKDKKLTRIVNISLNETLGRTILTSLTLFVVTVMMNVFTTGMVRNFAFAMNVGVLVGVYSSIFIAAPVFLYLDSKFYGSTAAASASRKTARPSSKKPTPAESDE